MDGISRAHSGILLFEALILAASFAIILLGSELFTNGVEWMGEKLGIAEQTVGSLLAAVGTALPETLIPLLALVMGRRQTDGATAVGLGAIVGAPLMLSTVALFVMGVASIVYRKRRGRITLKVSRDGARHDLSFFIPLFFVLLLMGLGSFSKIVRQMVAATLIVVYCIYGIIMMRLERTPQTTIEHGLHFETLAGRNSLEPRSLAVAIQIFAGLGAIIVGAHHFIQQILYFADKARLDPGILSLILSPLATELPEKYNSVVWIRQRKDHLALANITGAMVFQACIPVALGVGFTPWKLSNAELLAGFVGVISSVLLYFNLRKGELSTLSLMTGGLAYGVFLTGLVLIRVL